MYVNAPPHHLSTETIVNKTLWQIMFIALIYVFLMCCLSLKRLNQRKSHAAQSSFAACNNAAMLQLQQPQYRRRQFLNLTAWLVSSAVTWLKRCRSDCDCSNTITRTRRMKQAIFAALPTLRWWRRQRRFVGLLQSGASFCLINNSH